MTTATEPRTIAEFDDAIDKAITRLRRVRAAAALSSTSQTRRREREAQNAVDVLTWDRDQHVASLCGQYRSATGAVWDVTRLAGGTDGLVMHYAGVTRLVNAETIENDVANGDLVRL